MKLLAISLTSILLSLSLSAQSQEMDDMPPPPPLEFEGDRGKPMHRMKMGHKRQKMEDRMMSGADANKDSKVSRDEYLSFAEKRFTKMDLDGDGFITSEEMRGWSKNMRKEHFEAMKKAREEYRDATKEAREVFKQAQKDIRTKDGG